MDFNLTGLLWGMPVDFTGHATQDTNWPPLIVPLIAVVLTAILTYTIASTIEENRHRKELKRIVYFELIDFITKAKKVYEDNKFNPVSDDPKKDVERKDREMMIATEFTAAKFKTYVGGSNELNNLIDKELSKDILKDCDLKTYQQIMKKLIGQMKRELITPTILERIKKRGGNSGNGNS